MPQSDLEVEVPETVQAPAPERKGIRMQIGVGNLTTEQVSMIRKAANLPDAPQGEAAVEGAAAPETTPETVTTETPSDAQQEIQSTEEAGSQQAGATEQDGAKTTDALARNAGEAQKTQGERIPEEVAQYAQQGKNFLSIWDGDPEFQKAYLKAAQRKGVKLNDAELAFIADPPQKSRVQAMSDAEFNKEVFGLLAKGDAAGAAKLMKEREVTPELETLKQAQARREAAEAQARQDEQNRAQYAKAAEDIVNQCKEVATAYPKYCRMATESERQNKGIAIVFLDKDFEKRVHQNIEGVSASKVRLINAAKAALAEMGRLGEPTPTPTARKSPAKNPGTPARASAKQPPAKGKVRLSIPVYGE